jgi:hypothetical protein
MKQTKTPIAKPANGNGSAPPANASPDATIPGDRTPLPDELIAVTAYFHSERRGFAPGDELGDWFKAESECKNRFSGSSQ